eukprot:TRINITY_DN10910_c1_g3_i1.p1 TRINITY_DN10910_c1_g3~~TRINITY_DN10910_c1_g3_i1.p1  ORF type:complete len:130 (-),score=13.98 TRINITY_DN10910_c1_g3_i1:1969-2358(-)
MLSLEQWLRQHERSSVGTPRRKLVILVEHQFLCIVTITQQVMRLSILFSINVQRKLKYNDEHVAQWKVLIIATLRLRLQVMLPIVECHFVRDEVADFHQKESQLPLGTQRTCQQIIMSKLGTIDIYSPA